MPTTRILRSLLALAFVAALPVLGQQTFNNIDVPSSGGTYSGTVTFAGWAVDDTTNIAAIFVDLDGVHLGQFATYGVNRPDVCANYVDYPGCPNVGFNYTMDTTMLPNGWHSFDIQIVTTDGRTTTETQPFQVNNANPSILDVDTPVIGGVYTGSIVLGGWVLDPSAAYSQVNVYIDGAYYGPASVNGYRPDVCAVFPGYPGCPNVGWSLSFNTANLFDGNHQLSIAAVTTDQRTRIVGPFAFQTTNSGLGPSIDDIDTPTAGSSYSGTVNFGGWAIDAATPIAQVNVFIDGVPNGTASIGGNRPDVCAVYVGYAGCPNVGWNYSFNTATLPNGPHALSITAVTTDGRITASNVQPFLVSTPLAPSLVVIDVPQNGLNYSGLVTASGWAIDAAATISQVNILVDGTQVGTATYGSSRPDVCAIQGNDPGCPNVGWTYSLNTENLSNGSHQIVATAITSDGRSTNSGPKQFTVSNLPPNTTLITIDVPANAANVSNTITASGWALDSSATISQVNVLIDGNQVGSATIGINRPDVCAAIGNYPGCPNMGWTYSLNSMSLSNGSHQLTINAITSDGRSATSAPRQFTVYNLPANTTVITIDAPTSGATLSGTVTASGWALDSSATVSQVNVSIDGSPVGSATYGINRPDVCAAVGNYPGCPNVGWSFPINTSNLSVGSHQMTITAITADGRSTTSPSLPFQVPLVVNQLQPTKEYIRLGGQIIAIENAPQQ